MTQLSEILQRAGNGEPVPSAEILPLVYDELKRMATEYMRNEKPGQTLSATGLVHEAFLRLADTGKGIAWNSRGHFFSAAAEAMRRVLVEAARRKKTAKRGGGWHRISLEGITDPDVDADELIALHEALQRLEAQKPQVAELTKLRYFTGLTNAEAADILGISERTAKYWWAFAKAWLHAELSGRC